MDRSRGRQGITAFVIDRPPSGLDIRPLSLVGRRRGRVCEVVFRDVVVPVDARLGEEGEGMRIVGVALNLGRFSVASRCVGQAQAALERALSYAQQRHAFGQPIGRFQMIQAKLTHMITQTQAARLLVRQLGQMKDAGVPQVFMMASMAKLFASDVAMRVIMDAVQIHGGTGSRRNTTWAGSG